MIYVNLAESGFFKSSFMRLSYCLYEIFIGLAW